MSTAPERIAQIKAEHVGQTGKRVLLVEGTDDVDAYRGFLTRKFPGWERAWHLEPAGSKARVVQMAKIEPTWLGLVDRDEWTDAEITKQRTQCPSLLILPRFCVAHLIIAYPGFPHLALRNRQGVLVTITVDDGDLLLAQICAAFAPTPALTPTIIMLNRCLTWPRSGDRDNDQRR